MPPPSLLERYAAARRTGVPLVGGHRGNPAELPENTLASFRSAIELGVDIIECDVHRSSDGELFVLHDHTLERTTDGKGFAGAQTLESLRGLDAGSGERIPLLAEVVDVAREGGVALAIELKQLPLPYDGIEQQVIDLVRERAMLDQVAVISFNHPSVRLAKQLEPALQVGLLDAARPVDPVRLLEESNADIWSPHYGTLDPALVAEVHAAGRSVGVWTVDDEAAIAWCLHCRPDSVFTNRPREVLSRLKQA